MDELASRDKTIKRSTKTPVERILSSSDLLHRVPAFPTSANALSRLPEQGRRNAEMLAMVAQKDPVFLARLVSLAERESKQHLAACSATEALRVLGTLKSLTVMLEHAPCDTDEFNVGSTSYMAQQFVMQRSLAYFLTSMRLARYLNLGLKQSLILQLACLFDNVGLHAGIYAGREAALPLRQECCSKYGRLSYVLRESSILPDYHLLSLYLAHKWHAPHQVVETLTPDGNQMHALLLAVESVVDAKLKKASQQHALMESLSDHPRWMPQLRQGEIELAFIP